MVTKQQNVMELQCSEFGQSSECSGHYVPVRKGW